MQKIILDPGIISQKSVAEIIDNFDINVTIVTEKYRDISYYTERKINSDNYQDIAKRNLDIETIDFKTYQSVLNNSVTWMFFDRLSLRDIYSESDKARKISEIISRYSSYLAIERPDALVFMATPHNLFTWIFALCAEIKGVKVVYFQQLFIPWRVAIFEGIINAPVQIKISMDNCGKEPIQDFFNSKRGTAMDALPLYERIRLEKNENKFFNLKRELVTNFNKPFHVLWKYICFKAYLKHSTKSLPTRYVVFFLHFQPERTTLPEGREFANQMLAIQILVAALPAGVSLIVKEHPSIFTNTCDFRHRRPHFYEGITDAGAILASIDISAYDLIDESIGAASITGTVLAEALIRGKPAVSFGAGPLTHLKHTAFHRFTTSYEIKDFLMKCNSEENSLFKDSVTEALCRTLDFSVTGYVESKITDSKKSEEIKDSRHRAIISGLNQLFSQEKF